MTKGGVYGYNQKYLTMCVRNDDGQSNKEQRQKYLEGMWLRSALGLVVPVVILCSP